jgi:hypothetical protein
MSRQFGNPRVNASLIREGRMIFQQLSQIFGDRQPQRATSYNDVLIEKARAEAEVKKARALEVPALKCAVCLSSNSTTVRDAVTIANGDAVCVTHLVKQQ